MTQRADGRRIGPLLAAVLAALAIARSSSAAPGLLLGVDDDSATWYSHTSSLVSIYRQLGSRRSGPTGTRSSLLRAEWTAVNLCGESLNG
jgi:hypothetical protein